MAQALYQCLIGEAPQGKLKELRNSSIFDLQVIIQEKCLLDKHVMVLRKHSHLLEKILNFS